MSRPTASITTGTADLSGGTVATSYATACLHPEGYTIVSAQGGLGGTTFAGLSGAAPTGFTRNSPMTAPPPILLAVDLDMREPEDRAIPANQANRATR